nr:MAG TPA: hypothetical protein [Caudoviricetes sp.]
MSNAYAASSGESFGFTRPDIKPPLLYGNFSLTR